MPHDIYPAPITVNWDHEHCGKPVLTELGYVGVDSASVAVQIAIGDLDPRVTVNLRCYTPEGDGCFRVLGGILPGLGRALVVLLPDEPEDD